MMGDVETGDTDFDVSDFYKSNLDCIGTIYIIFHPFIYGMTT